PGEDARRDRLSGQHVGERDLAACERDRDGRCRFQALTTTMSHETTGLLVQVSGTIRLRGPAGAAGSRCRAPAPPFQPRAPLYSGGSTTVPVPRPSGIVVLL